MPTLATARGPEELRLYAIGDVHGRLDLLRDIHARIAADLVARPCRRFRVVHCGDYIDRGPESRGVVDHLIEFCADGDAVCLAGNHDLYPLAFLRRPDRAGDHWLSFGGVETLASYGVESWGRRGPRPFRDIRDDFDDAIPESHRTFFESLPLIERHGDFLFVHAGIQPDRRIEKQTVADVTCIREPFLSHEGDLGAVVVHGHTVVREPAVRRNRVGIDTGAYDTGRLTCFVIEEASKGFLEPDGYAPLPAPPR